jgi:hypothetical protein
MNIENLPSPLEDVSYNITSFEYLGNLKLIELLWILCPIQKQTAHGRVLFKAHFLKAQVAKKPSLEKELDEEMQQWATKYIKNDKAIWYYLEQCYELKVKDFIKGFPNVMNVIKNEETFINHATPNQIQFLNILLNSTFCKAISNGQKPSYWDYITLLTQTPDNVHSDSPNTVLWVGKKMLWLSVRIIFQPNKQDKMLELVQTYFNALFGDYMLEVNLHYLFNYLYYKGVLKDIFEVNQEINEVTNESKSDMKEFEKIEWQGTQKELAELFVELKEKGFIPEIPTKLIKQYFTKSNTIEQVLKPNQDPKTKDNTYEGIYTPAYKPRFDGIRQKS